MLLKECLNVVTKEIILKKKLLGLFLVASLALAPRLSSADQLVDIAQKAGYKEATETYRPKSSLLIDANTGDILWQDNIDEVRDPASMSKAMSLYLVFDALSKGEIKEDTVITAKPTDEAIANIYEISNNKIVSGVKYTVSELITMTAVPSSNAATVMLANYLSDNDPDKWIDRMNEKSKELGMTKTNGTMLLELGQHPTKATTRPNVMIITTLTRRQPVIYPSWPITLSNITLTSLNTPSQQT